MWNNCDRVVSIRQLGLREDPRHGSADQGSTANSSIVHIGADDDSATVHGLRTESEKVLTTIRQTIIRKIESVLNGHRRFSYYKRNRGLYDP